MKKRTRLWLLSLLAFVGALVFLCRKDAGSVQPAASGVCPSSAPSVAASAVASTGAPAAPFALPTNQTASVRGTKPFVLRSEVKFQKSLRLVAESLGARTLGVLSPKKLLIEADVATCRRLSADPRFSGVSEYLPPNKVESELLARFEAGAKSAEVSIVTLDAADRARVVEIVKAGGGEILTGCLNSGDLVRASLSAELLTTLAARGDVRWMEHFERPHLMNDLAVEPEAMNVRPTWTVHGLSGAGQVVSTSDSGIDTGDPATIHEDLRNHILDIKVVTGCSTNDVNGHGSHTAGSIVGDGTLSQDPGAYPHGPIRGTAWGANLYAWFCGVGGSGISTPATCEELFRGDETGSEWWDAYIHSASWGSDSAGAYNARCASFDEYLWNNPDYLPVISAGNAGSGAQTIGSPAASKNVLAVGATQSPRASYILDGENGSPDVTASFSSRGPCKDGRIKPDISAPGVGILSTRSYAATYSRGVTKDGNYAYDTGTSMACPLTAGSVALVREWLCKRDEYTSVLPSAAMMKAVITGGAKGASTPNNDQGWGRVDLEETLYPSNRAVRLVDYIPFAEGDEFYYVVETTNAAPLDVQLCWVDYPGTAGSKGKSLVNDLDLTVEPLYGSDAKVRFGNGGDSEDVLNNLESVHIDAAPTNRYLITVSCSTILHDSTEGGAAALYIRGAFDPELTLEDETEGRVRIKSNPTKMLMSLDAALKAAADVDTIEVLAPIRLKAARTVEKNLTICATNAHPSASAVTFSSAAELTVGSGGSLAVTNVVFSHAGARTVDVLSGGALRVSSGVVLDEVRVAEADNLTLASPLTSAIIVDAPSLKTDGSVFGRCTDAAAGTTAAYLFNKYDEESIGEWASGNSLRWVNHPEVPLEVANVRLEPEEGEDVGYRSLNVLFKYKPAPTGAVAVVKSGTMTNAFAAIDYDFFLYGTGADVAVTAEPTARFTVQEGGSLVISNLTFRDYVGPRLFHVAGGEMTLAKGATLLNLQADGTAANKTGATFLESGVLTMLPGSKVRNCQVPESTYGGGICAYGGTLRLLGGTVSGCTAKSHTYGGGVLVWNDDIEIAGDFSCKNNTSGAFSDNLRFMYGAYGELPCVTTALASASKIGISGFEPGDEGAPFAVVTASLMEDKLVAAAKVFSCDEEDNYFYASYEISESETNLIWKVRDEETGECDPEFAKDLVVYGYGTPAAVTNYYDTIGHAFEYAKENGTVVMLEAEEPFNADLAVAAPGVRLVSGCGSSALYREAECSISIPAGTALAISNVVVYGNHEDDGGACTLLDVSGGALALEAGASVRNACGDESYAVAGVCVSKSGTFTMESGSSIANCTNLYLDVKKGVYDGRGGGLLLLSGTAYLKGGTISNCVAKKGGVYLANAETRAFVSGDFAAVGNLSYDEITEEWTACDNLEFDGIGRIVLAGEWTGSAGVTRSEVVTGLGTNEFGLVEYTGELTNLASSATNFYQDANVEARGCIVTNGTTALLVWSTAIDGSGRYVSDDGLTTNWLVRVETPAPGPEPEPEPEYVEPMPIAFKSITRVSDVEWGLVVTDRVQWAEYRLLWTADLAKGFTSTGAWEQAVVDGEWTTNVLFAAPAPAAVFWKAEGQKGEKEAE